MSKSTITVPKGTRIAVVGDIHEHKVQFDQLLQKLQPSDSLWLVSVGDIYDKGYGPEQAEDICQQLSILTANKTAYAVQGNHELKHLKKMHKPGRVLSPGLAWCRDLPLAITFQFSNDTQLTVVHGGVTPHHTWEDLEFNPELCYVRSIDDQGKMIRLVRKTSNGQVVLMPEKPNGRLWHQLYDGRFGYIASGHDAQKDGIAKFYDFSCNLDTCCYETGILTAQIFGEAGREDLLTVQGPARKPDLNLAFGSV